MAVGTEQPVQQTIGNYDLVEKIAEGGMGTVWKGRSRANGQYVAIKVVPPHLLTNQVFLKRFEQEYNAAKAIDHPNIVRAMEFGRDGTSPYLVMEYVQGETLGQKLDREIRLSEEDAVRLITQVANGLSKAHQKGLIHRDVKPDNILLTRTGLAKLTDLGLVKEVDADLNLTRTGRGLGTPHFMAPEQFRNAKNADIRCDIYSLAATLYMMVTGELPFKSCGPLDAWMKKIHNEIQPPKALFSDISDRIDWAIRRSMSADPQQRAGSCQEFVEDITGQSQQSPVPKDPTTSFADLWYMVYKDENGVVHTVKGSTGGIRRSLKENLLDPTSVRIARTKSGPFELLQTHPEFRDLVVEPGMASTLLKQKNAQQQPNGLPEEGPRSVLTGKKPTPVEDPPPSSLLFGNNKKPAPKDDGPRSVLTGKKEDGLTLNFPGKKLEFPKLKKEESLPGPVGGGSPQITIESTAKSGGSSAWFFLLFGILIGGGLHYVISKFIFFRIF